MTKGIYVLVISVFKDTRFKVGVLGNVLFEKGLYAYVGSAQNHLEKRIARHFGRSKRIFWHVDYLLNDDSARILRVFYKEGDKQGECALARRLGQIGIPVKGFGASDCQCESHLFKVENWRFLTESMNKISLQSV